MWLKKARVWYWARTSKTARQYCWLSSGFRWFHTYYSTLFNISLFYPVMTTVQIPFFYYYMLCFVCWTAVIGLFALHFFSLITHYIVFQCSFKEIKLFLVFNTCFLMLYSLLLGVQSAAVNVICELARRNPKNYLSLAPLFFKLMTSSTNNWVLIKIIKLVRLYIYILVVSYWIDLNIYIYIFSVPASERWLWTNKIQKFCVSCSLVHSHRWSHVWGRNWLNL